MTAGLWELARGAVSLLVGVSWTWCRAVAWLLEAPCNFLVWGSIPAFKVYSLLLIHSYTLQLNRRMYHFSYGVWNLLATTVYIQYMCDQDNDNSCNVNYKIDIAMGNCKMKLDIGNMQWCVYWYSGIFFTYLSLLCCNFQLTYFRWFFQHENLGSRNCGGRLQPQGCRALVTAMT